MRSASRTASLTLCVTKTIVLPIASQIRISSFCNVRRVCASSAPKGSSIRSMRGSLASARAMAVRCCIPPDTSWGRWCSKPLRFTRSMKRFAARLALALRERLELERKHHVAFDRAPREKAVFLKDHAARSARTGLRGAVDPDLAARGRREAREGAQQRRLPASARADEADELALRDLEVDAGKGGRHALVAREIFAQARDADQGRQLTSPVRQRSKRRSTIVRNAVSTPRLISPTSNMYPSTNSIAWTL